MNRTKFMFVLLLMASGTAAVAQPQIPRPGTPEYRFWELRQRQAKPEEWTVTGKIHSFNVAAGEVNVLSDDNQQWRVKFGNDAQVSVKGEGGAEFLQPRTAVRFYAPITKRKLVTEPVAKLTTFTPRPPFEAALEPTTEEEARAAMAEEETGQEGAETDATEGEFEAESTDDRPALQDRVNRQPEGPSRGRPPRGRDSKAEDDAEAEWYHVTGILVSLKKNKFVVDTGEEGGRIRGELAEDAKVEADLLGIQFANPGDAIQAKGKTSPAQPGFAIATSADVTLVAQPESAEENPRRTSRGRGRRAEGREPPSFGAEAEKPEATRPKRSNR